ncbi:prepilin-type N-terminal cleavage/methylation domain-containing protein [Dyella choica]|uniref:Prepilin-type N-terminal cleavage/methylation domain-containing protein n=1 Tax=Dyella choica TaxID=1927959 RepID=A0A3S0WV02_9GAMM|nr:prepilin-type N-terminal cleavage/methylation domain-containing protein [Dyella choica]RUL74047.1 prepilin-type N-terminal cleavage/methylation domain-containing protein [Dyella choica]
MRRRRGFTLVELMVAMLLGLIVIGGVTSVFLAGQQTYRTNDALGDVEDGSRTAFELLARDLRNAGLTGCDNTNGRIANVLSNSTLWYTNWNDALYGYDDASTDPALNGLTGVGAPVAGNSSVHVLSTALTDVTVSFTPGSGQGSSANIHITAGTSQLAANDLIMVCDFDHATILQITNYSGNQTVVHNMGTGSIGNCSKELGYPVLCTPNGNHYDFQSNARIAVLTANTWYIGTNPVGGQSLYRLNVGHGTGGVAAAPQEMVRNVTVMKVQYLQPPNTAFKTAALMTNWAAVDAAQIQLTVKSANLRADVTNSTALSRSFTSTTTVRNRVQ